MANYSFEPIPDFTPGNNWHKHTGSRPDHLYDVRDSNGCRLDINIGYSSFRANTRAGYLIASQEPQRLDGGRVRIARLSGYTCVDPSAHDRFTRPRIEKAFILDVLFGRLGFDIVQNPVLFNVRDYPLQGLWCAVATHFNLRPYLQPISLCKAATIHWEYRKRMLSDPTANCSANFAVTPGKSAHYFNGAVMVCYNNQDTMPDHHNILDEKKLCFLFRGYETPALRKDNTEFTLRFFWRRVQKFSHL